MKASKPLNRRRFLGSSLAGAGMLASARGRAAGRIPTQGRKAFAKTVVETPFARIEQLAEGVWAVVSTPFKPEGGFGDMTTVCNGGLIAGRDGLLVIDTFQRPEGAAWVVEQGLRLTGKRPTHVLLTHFHGDHSGGLAGFQYGAQGPDIIASETTRQLIWDRYQRPRSREGSPFLEVRQRFLAPTSLLSDKGDPVELDLGGRNITIERRAGHTPSDLAVVIDDPRIVFDGDLVWKDVFPNYADALPHVWQEQAREILRDPETIHVAGHGDVARGKDLVLYPAMLDEVEKAARQAHGAGREFQEAAAEFSLPQSLGDWLLFNPNQYETAFRAWYRTLDE